MIMLSVVLGSVGSHAVADWNVYPRHPSINTHRGPDLPRDGPLHLPEVNAQLTEVRVDDDPGVVPVSTHARHCVAVKKPRGWGSGPIFDQQSDCRQQYQRIAPTRWSDATAPVLTNSKCPPTAMIANAPLPKGDTCPFLSFSPILHQTEEMSWQLANVVKIQNLPQRRGRFSPK